MYNIHTNRQHKLYSAVSSTPREGSCCSRGHSGCWCRSRPFGNYPRTRTCIRLFWSARTVWLKFIWKNVTKIFLDIWLLWYSNSDLFVQRGNYTGLIFFCRMSKCSWRTLSCVINVSFNVFKLGWIRFCVCEIEALDLILYLWSFVYFVVCTCKLLDRSD